MTRTRLPLVLLLCTAFTLGLAACGDDEPTADNTEVQSDGKQDEASDSGSNDSSSSDDSSNEDVSDAIDDLGDIAGMDNLEECIAIAGTYAGLAMSALGGEDAAQDAIDAIGDLETKLPSELDDALATVADAYGEVAEKGFIDGAEALDSDEFKEADAEIQAYLEETCGTS